MANKLLSYGSLAHLWEIITGKLRTVDRYKSDRAAMRVEVPGHLMLPTSLPGFAYRMIQHNKSGDYLLIMNIPTAKQQHTIDLGTLFPQGHILGYPSALIDVIPKDSKQRLIGPAIVPEQGSQRYTIPTTGAVVALYWSNDTDVSDKVRTYTHISVNMEGNAILLRPREIIRRDPVHLGIKNINAIYTIGADGKRLIEKFFITDSYDHKHLITEEHVQLLRTGKKSNLHYEIQWLSMKKRRIKNFTPGAGLHQSVSDKPYVKKWKKSWRRQPYGYIRVREIWPPNHKIRGEWKYYKFSKKKNSHPGHVSTGRIK